jgi:Ca2+-binding EF-hand superfamily protein
MVTSVEGMRHYDTVRLVKRRMIAKKAGTALKLVGVMKHNMNLTRESKSWDPTLTMRSRAIEVWPDVAIRAEREDQVNTVFAHFDKNHNGFLNRVETRALLRKMCIGTSSEERDEMIEQIISRGGEEIVFEILFDWIAPIIKSAENSNHDTLEDLESLAYDLFKMVVEKDCDEITPLQFFTQVEDFMTSEDRLSLEDIQALFREFDVDDDGRLGFDEFIGFVSRYCVE